jgi:hypothetical protein
MARAMASRLALACGGRERERLAVKTAPGGGMRRRNVRLRGQKERSE